jgi:hypothetical protein
LVILSFASKKNAVPCSEFVPAFEDGVDDAA